MFTYVQNNPVELTDPFGLSCSSDYNDCMATAWGTKAQHACMRTYVDCITNNDDNPKTTCTTQDSNPPPNVSRPGPKPGDPDCFIRCLNGCLKQLPDESLNGLYSLYVSLHVRCFASKS